jgi:hypothetical protein
MPPRRSLRRSSNAMDQYKEGDMCYPRDDQQRQAGRHLSEPKD